mmetsp:Transcript_7376/g.20908  ORF Transcript_7376/g.20908 Transcript_7376/m.20908 type:complete len:95 (-) Transcript_7376:339-623(-)
MKDVISVTNPCDCLASQIHSEVLLKSHKIRQGLKWVVEITQGINDWNTGIFCQLDNVCVRINSSQNDRVKTAQNTCSISHTFIDTQLNIRGSQK